jgi:hypothetical protein
MDRTCGCRHLRRGTFSVDTEIQVNGFLVGTGNVGTGRKIKVKKGSLDLSPYIVTYTSQVLHYGYDSSLTTTICCVISLAHSSTAKSDTF